MGIIKWRWFGGKTVVCQTGWPEPNFRAGQNDRAFIEISLLWYYFRIIFILFIHVKVIISKPARAKLKKVDMESLDSVYRASQLEKSSSLPFVSFSLFMGIKVVINTFN